MLTKRIIPCLDVKDDLVVKGKNFVSLKFAGDPVELARKYSSEGADELVFLDITASYEKRKTMIETVRKVAAQVFIPLTVGGGVSSIKDIRSLLNAGADKIAINSAAVKNPWLINQAAKEFGSQCIVVAIDAKKVGNDQSKKWKVFIEGGRKETFLDAIDWAKEAEKRGAGEILLTSMDRDGTKRGFDTELTRLISKAANIPIISSGGAGTLGSLESIFREGKADAALAASIFHYDKYSINEVKKYLKNKGVDIRC
ncbi:MAG: imidazole glycerol phosphate synthase subunit HisF [Nanoarchaeota archaeon]|nr:imidazole glycerol phosphate synthase subunit HisF [Nanoarchaeota archaeon]